MKHFEICKFQVIMRIFVIPRDEGSPRLARQRLVNYFMEFLAEIPRRDDNDCV